MTKLIKKAQKGETISSLYERKTGKPWSTAKKEGLTSGSYEDNMKLKQILLSGNFDLEKIKSIEKVKENMSIESSRDSGPVDETGYKYLKNNNYNNIESFQEAFTKARKELGTGKTFEYKGKLYSTNYKEEINSNSKNKQDKTKLIPKQKDKQDKTKQDKTKQEDKQSKTKQEDNQSKTKQEDKQEDKQSKTKLIPKQEDKQELHTNYPWTQSTNSNYIVDKNNTVPHFTPKEMYYINNAAANHYRLNPEKYDIDGNLLPASGAVEVTASPIEYLTPVPKIGLLKPVIKPVTKPITKSVENVTTAILRKKLIKQVPVNKKISDVVNAAIYQTEKATEKAAEKAASKAEKAAKAPLKVVDKRFLQPTTFNYVPKITYKNPNISFKMPYHVKK